MTSLQSLSRSKERKEKQEQEKIMEVKIKIKIAQSDTIIYVSFFIVFSPTPFQKEDGLESSMVLLSHESSLFPVG